MSQPKIPDNKRPISITIICTLNFILLPIIMYILLYSMQQPYPEENLQIPFYMIAMFLVVNIGLWNMKKWAAYSYVCFQVLGESFELATGDRSSQAN